MTDNRARGELTHHFDIGSIAITLSRGGIQKPTTTHHTHHGEPASALPVSGHQKGRRTAASPVGRGSALLADPEVAND
jgi:hypothetical protein